MTISTKFRAKRESGTMLKMLDLFSGIGGFSLAGHWAGFETVAFCEKDKFCQKILEKHWPNVPIFNDIKDFNYNKYVDLLTCSCPCQPFSVAGKRKGFNDERHLWPEAYRIIKQCNPAWVIYENVPGVIPYIDTVLDDLEREDYSTWSLLIPASAIGAPHKRERLWVIANTNVERCDMRGSNRKKGDLQDDLYGYIEEIYSQWPQFIPQSWEAFNAQEWIGFTADSNSAKCEEGTENNETVSKRSERTNAAAEIGNATGNAHGITSGKTYQETITKPSERHTRQRYSGQFRKDFLLIDWEEDKPPAPGMDDGLSKRLHGVERNRALGNSIVPSVIYPIMKLIYMIEKNYE